MKLLFATYIDYETILEKKSTCKNTPKNRT